MHTLLLQKYVQETCVQHVSFSIMNCQLFFTSIAIARQVERDEDLQDLQCLQSVQRPGR